MENEIQSVPKESTAPKKDSKSYDIACQTLIQSGLLASLSDTDVGRILDNMKYELITFEKRDQLIREKEPMDYFLILNKGTLSVLQGSGEMLIQPGTIWKDQVIGLDVCFSRKKTSYYDIYAATAGMAVKYDFRRLLDTRRISTVSRIALLTNMVQYISELYIVLAKKFDLMKMRSVDHRILLYLMQKEDAYKGSPLNMRYFVGIKKHLGITVSEFSNRLIQLEEKGILTLEGKKVIIKHPQAEAFLKEIRQSW